jgi:hypothetical protein
MGADIAGLCERLRAAPTSRLVGSLGQAVFTPAFWPVFTNPDGPEAADTLERQAAEIERLRLALVEAGMRIETCPGAYKSHVEIIVQKIRAALTREDTATLSLSGKTQTDARTRGDECTS